MLPQELSAATIRKADAPPGVPARSIALAVPATPAWPAAPTPPQLATSSASSPITTVTGRGIAPPTLPHGGTESQYLHFGTRSFAGPNLVGRWHRPKSAGASTSTRYLPAPVSSAGGRESGSSSCSPAPCALSAVEIEDQLREGGPIGRATIYRAPRRAAARGVRAVWGLIEVGPRNVAPGCNFGDLASSRVNFGA
jgi:hypothetical protein